MEREEILREILKIIRRYLPEKDFKIFLFGSWAKESAEPTSDIDIGILGKESVEGLVLIRIKGEIEAIPTLRKIDVVDLKAVDDKFREGVLSYAKQL
jgi:predicted nucleotidyltransferase